MPSLPKAFAFFIIAYIMLAFFAVFFAIPGAYAAGSPELDKQQRQMFGVSVQIDKSCSGTIVYSSADYEKSEGKVRTIILTAKHCIDDAARDYRVNIPVYHKNRIVKEDSYVARVFGQYANADLALIILKDDFTVFPVVAKVSPKDPELFMGESVWTVGYPLGLPLTVTPGAFGSLETLDYPTAGIEYIRATPNIAPGNSGGALYHLDQDGNYALIGVTTAGFRGFSWINVYTPINTISEYLRVALPKMVVEKTPASYVGTPR